MNGRGHDGERRGGVTLVEALVAIGLSALVLSLLFTVLESTRRMLTRQQSEFRAGTLSPEEGARILVRELTSATDREDGNPAMDMRREGASWRLRWTAAYLLPGPEPASGCLPLEIRYENGAVYRIEGRMDEQAQTPWLMDIERMDLQFQDGTVWHDDWPPDTDDTDLPAAVRLKIHPRGAEPFSVEISLPVAALREDPSSTSNSAR